MQKEKALRILLLEDRLEDVDFIERILKKDGIVFESECVDTREEFSQALTQFKPDVVLSDHGLPQFNSMEALKICKEERMEGPFILVTGTVSEEFAITCLRQGADDYILKSNLSRLPSAIKRALRQRKLEKMRLDTRKRLRKQNRELSKVNQELDNFVYSVSHNLRSPLASITGLIHLAKQVDKDPYLLELHERMEDSISKLDETLKEILDYSRNVRNGIHYEEIDLEDLVDATLDKLHYLGNSENMVKNMQVMGAGKFYSDKARLQIVLRNLLANSLLYKDKTRPLYLYIQAFLDEDRATLILSDNGIGIEEEIQSRIFEMFYRGTEMSKGAGLGLYIAREMVMKLGGKITFNSIPGEGTTFVVSLPNFDYES